MGITQIAMNNAMMMMMMTKMVMMMMTKMMMTLQEKIAAIHLLLHDLCHPPCTLGEIHGVGLHAFFCQFNYD